MIVYAEDKALKCCVQKVSSHIKIACRVRIPKSAGAGWTEVLENVRKHKDQFCVIGIIEGDSRKHAEQHAFWNEVSDRIYVTKDEVESYLFKKRAQYDCLGELRVVATFSSFKKKFNDEDNTETMNRAFAALSEEDCEELNRLKDFLWRSARL